MAVGGEVDPNNTVFEMNRLSIRHIRLQSPCAGLAAAEGTAISLSKTFFADPYFIYAVAKTDAGLGKFADAQTAIRVLAKKRPQVKDTKDFLSTVDFIFDKMKESKDKSPAG